jgi:putative acetyltransferase
MDEHKVAIGQATSQAEIDGVRTLLREYIAWAIPLEPNAEKAAPFQGIEEELATLPGIYAPPSGRVLAALHEGEVVGCVCLKGIDETTCEVKRLYVSPAKRGLTIGTLLVERLVEEARQCGYERIILDSHKSMTKAHAIYEAAGFQRVPAPPDFQEELKSVAIFMECNLST